MGWDRKRKGPSTGYFYASKRVPGKRHPVKVYVGRGDAGHEAAAAVERRRQGRREAERLLLTDRNPTTEADRLAADLYEWAEVLSVAWLILTGHHRRRGEWRRTRDVAKKPREGTRAWELTLHRNPVYIKNTILNLVKRAEGGDTVAVESLYRWLQRHPEMRSLVRELDDLATKVERCWVQRMCGTDELSKKVIEDDLAAMKAEMLGPAPSVTDKILASAVVVAHLAFQRAAVNASQKTDLPVVQEARERLMSIALKRLVAATRAWSQVAEKKAKGLRPRGRLKLFDPTVAA